MATANQMPHWLSGKRRLIARGQQVSAFIRKELEVKPTLDNDRPLFLQIKEAIEDDILAGALLPDEQIPSNSTLVSFYQINPVTVHKGVALLADEGTVYKKRGLGMFVSPDAPARLRRQRQGGFKQEYVKPAVTQAQILGVQRTELHNMIDETWGEELQ